MNIIIGSSGFLGSYLSSKLVDKINIVSNKKVIDNTVNYDIFIELWKKNNYKNSIIYICADYISNTKIIYDLSLSDNNNNNTFILFSSAVIYNGIIKDSYSEIDYNDNLEDNNNLEDNYINTIKNNEKIFNKINGIKIIIRLGTLYGSSINLNASRGIQRMIYFGLINNYIEIDDKKLKKSLTSLDDLLNGLYKILELHNKLNFKKETSIYNISSFNITIGNLAEYISQKLSIPIKYITDTKINYSFFLNTSKLELLNWKPNSTLSNIIDTITNNFNLTNEIKIDNIIIYKIKKHCRVCNSLNIFEVLNLNKQPPPNRLNDNFWKLLNIPLILNCCSDCFHLQLNSVFNPLIMYKNYTYLSGTSKTMNNYFQSFVNNIINKKHTTVLDIACNDCALLDCFKNNGLKTYGIDPAENIVSGILNHNIYCGFFNNKSIEYFNIIFDIVTVFNVFAHVDDIYEFLNNLYKITNSNSDIYIQTSQCNMIQNNEFDTVYHEHLSFFNINSFNIAINKSNFYLKDVSIPTVHGFSYLFHIKQKIDSYTINQNVNDRYNYELKTGIYNIETYNKYAHNIYQWKDKLINILKKYKFLIGVGASAKGITILNFIKNDLISNNIVIDCILDENQLKINKKIKSINTTINHFNYLKNIDLNIQITFILFAWNYKDELIEKVKKIRNCQDIFINLSTLEIF